MRTRKFEKKKLQTAVAAALAVGVIAASTVQAAGTPVTSLTTYALEAIGGGGTLTLGLTVPTEAKWQWQSSRNPSDGNTEVTIFAPAGWAFSPIGPGNPTGPVLQQEDGAGALVPGSTCALSQGGGSGIGGDDTIAKYECTSPLFGVRGQIPVPPNPVGSDEYVLQAGYMLDQVSGDFCLPAAPPLLGLAISIIDDSQFPVEDLDGTSQAGTPMGAIATFAPASNLVFTAKPFEDGDDVGFTTTNVFAIPPFSAFLPRGSTPIPNPFLPPPPPIGPDDSDVPPWARSTFKIYRSLGPVDLGGTVPYMLSSLDTLMLNVHDPMQSFAGLASLCAGGGAGDPACVGNPNQFIPVGTTATLTGPADLPQLLNAPDMDRVILQYNADGLNTMGPQRVLTMDGKVTGPLNCVVPYNPPGEWEWGANGLVLEAHDIEKGEVVAGVPVERHTVQLTNNCTTPAPYTFYVGDGTAANNALSCGTATPPAGLACSGVIPGASGGQPGNVTIGTGKLTKAATNAQMTARAYIATSPNCAHGSYDELDQITGARRTTIMERDFFGRLDD